MDKFTYLAAWIGAATGICSLVWNIYLKLSSGPKLRIHAHAGMVMIPQRVGNPRYLRIVVRNIGNAPTTITNYSFHSFRGFRARFRKTEFNSYKTAVLSQYSGKQCPTKLDVGEEVNILMEQNSEFDQWLRGGLWVGVHHSFGHGAQLVKIFQAEKKSQAKGVREAR